MARVNLESGKVEYLEVPVQVSYAAGKKSYEWQKEITTETLNSRGMDVARDKRSRRDGWHWNFNGNPIAINDNIYFTTMAGLCYVLDTKAGKWDSKAFLSLNDLGPAAKTWSVNTPSFANGKFYHRTLKELICIQVK